MPKNTKSEKSVSTVQKVADVPQVAGAVEVAPVATVTPVTEVAQIPEVKKTAKKVRVPKAVDESVVVAPVVVAPVAVAPVAPVVVAETVSTDTPTVVKAAKKPRAPKAERVVVPEQTTQPVVAKSPEEPVADAPVVGGARAVRYFRCIYNADTFGRFSGYKPKQAAGKALTSILRHLDKEGQDLFSEVPFSMIECTRGGNHKVSQYNGKRLKLEKPVTVTIKTSDGNKKEIKYNFTNKITKVKSEKKTAKKSSKKVAKKAVKKPVEKKTAKAPKTVKKTPVKKISEKKAVAKKADA